MFERQIDLLVKFISDWEKNDFTDWDTTKGLCANCKLGFDTLIYDLGFTQKDAISFLENMYKDFPEYTGNVYFPICSKIEYFPTPQDPPFVFKIQKRLSLAIYCLSFLRSLNK